MADRPRPPPRPAPPRPKRPRDSITQEFNGAELDRLLHASRDRELATIPDDDGEGMRIARSVGLKTPLPPRPSPSDALEDDDLLEDTAPSLPAVLSPALAQRAPPELAPAALAGLPPPLPAPAVVPPLPPPLVPPRLSPVPLAPPRLSPTPLAPRLSPTPLAPRLSPAPLAPPRLSPAPLAPPRLSPAPLAPPRLSPTPLPAPAAAPFLPPPVAPPPAPFASPVQPIPTAAPASLPEPSPPTPGLAASPDAWAMGQPSAGGARAGFAFTPETPETPRRPRGRLLAAVGTGAVLLGLGLYFALSPSSPKPATTALPSVAELAPAPALAPTAPQAPAEAPAAPPAPVPAATAQPEPSQVDTEAKEALTKLRDGMVECVMHGISTLPGSSPVLPARLEMTRAPGYTATPRDWKNAVWVCARFRLDRPLRFQLQWQLVKPYLEGRGIAWIDDDGDGNADRTLGFRIDMKAKHEPVLGDIGPIDALPKSLNLRP